MPVGSIPGIIRKVTRGYCSQYIEQSHAGGRAAVCCSNDSVDWQLARRTWNVRANRVGSHGLNIYAQSLANAYPNCVVTQKYRVLHAICCWRWWWCRHETKRTQSRQHERTDPTAITNATRLTWMGFVDGGQSRAWAGRTARRTASGCSVICWLWL